MRALIAAGLMAIGLLGGAGTAQADDASCPVTQLCGPVSREYPGDQDGDRYRELLNSYGMNGNTASAVKLARTICQKRAEGAPSKGLIAWVQDGLGYGAAVNAVAMAEYHFCPSYWDLG